MTYHDQETPANIPSSSSNTTDTSSTQLNGFTYWGLTESGGEIWSINDPSSYSWSDWYGY